MNQWIKAASLGCLTGMRSSAGLRSAGHAYGYEHLNPWFSRMILAEAMMDKMPFMPSRATPIPLIGRGAVGALAGSGVVIGRGRARERLMFGAVGAASAVLAAIVFAGLRSKIARKSRIASTLIGVAEDAVVITASRRIRAA